MPNEPRTDDFATRSGIQQTEFGLWLLIVGILVQSIPLITTAIGPTLIIIAVVSIALGRRAFGLGHSGLALRSALLYFVGFAAGIVNLILAFYLPFSSNTVIQFETGAMVAQAITGLALVLLTYALQDSIGRILLWSGYLGGIVVTALDFYAGGYGYLFLLQSPYRGQFPVLTWLDILPAALTATAYYLAWRRINKGEIPEVQTWSLIRPTV